MSNKSWSKMGKKEKRIAIAQDVIAQVRINLYDVDTGDYLRIIDAVPRNTKEELRTLIQEKQVNCVVCGKGALFLGVILKENHCSLNNADNSEEMCSKRLTKIFSQGQLDMIETAFEEEVIKDHTDILESEDFGEVTSTKLGNKCIKFGNKYKTPKTRLIGIMNNIIKNDGIFVP